MRIIAGRFGGRRLAANVPTGARPTSDRVREALFSMLEARGALLDARVLDLFAGTGALGLEALSRGAHSVVAVDQNSRAVQAIRRNAAALGVQDSVQCVRSDLSRPETQRFVGPFDLVLLDPPYAELAITDAWLKALAAGPWLNPGALVGLELAAAASYSLPSGWTELRHQRYGDSAIVLLAAMA